MGGAAEWEARAMTGNRWWHVLFATTILVLAIIAPATTAPPGGRVLGIWITLAALSLFYGTIGWRALTDSRLAWPLVGVMVIGSGVAVSFSPTMAIIQSIAFPLVWIVLTSKRNAIVANVALALAVGIGYVAGLGVTTEVILSAFLIEGISLVGSLALGLWISRIADLSNERQLLLDELTATQEQLAAVNRQTGETSERERLAREIHDTIAQSLTGVVMLTQRAQRELASGNLGPLAEQLGLLETSARDALVETRSLVAASAPVELGSGISAALDRLAVRFGRETGMDVTVSADVSVELDRDTEVVLLRCVQEALANVRKHSGAKTVNVDLRAISDIASLTVHDDGLGFDANGHGTGFGLPGMRDRLSLVRGELVISSSPNDGTTVSVSLPVSQPVSTA